MPLDDLVPKLDDRTFDDLMQEVRTRVARYTPEWRPNWTDVNDSDPGVTLAQVFAWLSEMLLYRMNRVPALNYVKFLQLIGVELAPAEPALAEVTLPVETTFADPVVRVPSRTQLSADPGDGGPTLIFETTRALVAFRAVLDQIAGYDPDLRFSDFTAAAQSGQQSFQPFGARAAEGAFLALGLVDAVPLPFETLDLAVVVAGNRQGAAYTTCSGSPLGLAAPAVLAWEYFDGAGWSALSLLRDDTLAFTRSGHVLLKLPKTGVPVSAKTSLLPGDLVTRYWLRARVVKSQYESPPELFAVRTNTVAVEQAETIVDEILGGSDGSRDQVFRVGNRPVLAGSLELDIQVSDEGPDRWTEVPDLFGAGPADDVYVLNRTTGEIRTGDGIQGNVPVAFAGDPGGNVVARRYRFGGGRRGNVAAGAISTLVSSVPGIAQANVTNFDAAHSGRDEETLAEAKKRAPSTLRSRDRAVTAADFEYLATQAANIARAKALPGFHPEFPALPLPGVVSVVVVPAVDGDAPMPSDATLQNVCRFLDERRLLTTELFVLKPEYQKVEVRADVVAAPTADAAQLHDAIVTALVDYFHPLRGGESGQGWPFGGKIHWSRVYQRVFGVPGVDSVTSLAILLDDEEQPQGADILVAPHGLLYSTDHAIAARYDDTEQA